MAELPRLQNEYKRLPHVKPEQIFIAVHAYIDDKDLLELKELLRQKHITFPVMIDSAPPDKIGYGKTSNYYRVFGVPTDIKIDEKGRFASIEPEQYVGGDSLWVKGLPMKPADKEKNKELKPSDRNAIP